MGGLKKGIFVLVVIVIFLFSVQTILSKPSKTAIIPCGSTITTNTTLDSDIGPCSGDGLIISTSGVTLDCAGHQIVGQLGFQTGINLQSVSGVTVKNCRVYNFSSQTLLLSSSSNNVIQDTVLSSFFGDPVKLLSSNNNLFNRVIFTGGFAFRIQRSNNNIFKDGEVSSLAYPVLLTIDSPASNNNTFLNMTFRNNGQPLEIGFDSNKIIRSRIINSPGIDINTHVAGVSNVLIEENLIMNNFGGGDSGQLAAIRVRGGSGHNITKNQIINNSVRGIELITTSGNFITSNTISNNTVGINITDITSNNNLIYNNYFNNPVNAQDNGNNFWNTTKTPGTNIIGGPFLGGNFWSDYTGVDTNGDGLGDTLIPFNRDYLPLVIPSIPCGSTITSNTTLTSDIGPCLGNGIVIGVNNIILDCAGYEIKGSWPNIGILLQSRSGVTIKNCIIRGGFAEALRLESSSNNIMQDTYLSGGDSSLRIRFGGSNNQFIRVNFTKSFAQRLEGTSNNVFIDGEVSYHAYPALLTTGGANNNNRFENMLFAYNGQPLEIGGSGNKIIRSRIINSPGIDINTHVFGVSNTLVEENLIMNNFGGGDSGQLAAIRVRGGSGHNITKNQIINNSVRGIELITTSGNSITSNTISNNTVGINITDTTSNNNLIYNNYFNNPINAQDNGNNFWNTSKILGTNIIGGPYLGGNFWSDYTGIDADGDGLGDTNLPHNSSGNILNGGDFLPLTKVGTTGWGGGSPFIFKKRKVSEIIT